MKRRTKIPRKRLSRPSLRFNPTAWAKLRFLRDLGDTEIGGFGLSAADDPLYIEDILLVKQRCTPVTVSFDDAAVADLVDRSVDQGIKPDRCSRIWIHTHPGNCPRPSFVDEATFRRVFGRNEWSVMAILAHSDATYARLAFHVGPGGSLEIPVTVDYDCPFFGTNCRQWEEEYRAAVATEPLCALSGRRLEDDLETWLDDPTLFAGETHGLADAEQV